MAADDLLSARIPLRLGVATASGPLIVPLWFEWDGTCFWCASRRDATVVTSLAREPLCAFDLSTNEIPYRGMRGQAFAQLRPDLGPATLERLIDRYLIDRDHTLATWLLSRADEEVAIQITPRRRTSWDYSSRMSGLY